MCRLNLKNRSESSFLRQKASKAKRKGTLLTRSGMNMSPCTYSCSVMCGSFDPSVCPKCHPVSPWQYRATWHLTTTFRFRYRRSIAAVPRAREQLSVLSRHKSSLVCTRRQSGIGLDRRRSDFYPNKWPIWTYLGPFFKYATFDRR